MWYAKRIALLPGWLRLERVEMLAIMSAFTHSNKQHFRPCEAMTYSLNDVQSQLNATAVAYIAHPEHWLN